MGQSDLLAVLQEEIIAVIACMLSIERARVHIVLDRGDPLSTLEIDVEVSSAAAAAVPWRAKCAGGDGGVVGRWRAPQQTGRRER